MSLHKWLRRLIHRPPWRPLPFPSNSFDLIDDTLVIDEERHPAFRAGNYYSMILGDVLMDRYQMVGELGFERSPTVWLARDMQYVVSDHRREAEEGD